jgi:hypothetical protein
MILNKNLIFSEMQAITGTAISQNVIQWSPNGTVPYEAAPISRNLGEGTPIPVMMLVNETFNTLTSLTITLETADNAALSSGAVVLATSGAILQASLVFGYRPLFIRSLPIATLKQYLGMRYTVAGSNPSTGKITAVLGTEIQT